MNALPRLLSQYTKPPAEPLPTLESVSPKYAELVARKVELNERLRLAQDDVVRLTRSLAGSDMEVVGEREQRIASLVGDPPPALKSPILEKINTTKAEVAELKEAARLVDIRVREEWLKASAAVCELVQEQHRAIMLEMFSKASELHAVWVQHEALIDELRRAGVAISGLRSRSPDFCGRHPSAKDAELACWMREMIEAGFVERSDLPELYR